MTPEEVEEQIIADIMATGWSRQEAEALWELNQLLTH